MQGTVKWFDDKKGFGFVEAGGKEYFVGFRSIVSDEKRKSLWEGESVEFDVVETPKGLACANVRVVKKERVRS